MSAPPRLDIAGLDAMPRGDLIDRLRALGAGVVALDPPWLDEMPTARLRWLLLAASLYHQCRAKKNHHRDAENTEKTIRLRGSGA